jgi:hypothetical protein
MDIHSENYLNHHSRHISISIISGFFKKNPLFLKKGLVNAYKLWYILITKKED